MLSNGNAGARISFGSGEHLCANIFPHWLSELVATSNPVDSIRFQFSRCPAPQSAGGLRAGVGLPHSTMFSRFPAGLHILVLLMLMASGASAQVASGDLDGSFTSSANAAVNAIAVQLDGKVIIGGAFTSVANQARGRLARLLTNGTVDTTFADPNLNGTVTGIAIQPDGKIIAIGKFTSAGTTSHNRIVRLNQDGTVDATFTVSLGSDAHSVLITPDWDIWVGGNFGLIRIDAVSGLVNTPAGADVITGAVYALALQPDGKLVIAGKFSKVGATARRNIARLGTDARLDTTFKADTDNSPDTDGNGDNSVASSAFSLYVQSDGKILVGGYFVRINGVARKYLARLEADGKVDTTFNPKPNGAVYAFAVDSVGDMVVGGEFTVIGGVARTCIAKLNSSGLPTSDFIRGGGQISGQTFSNVAPWVFSLAQTDDGQIYAGGYFTRIGGGERHRIARLVNSSTAGLSLFALLKEDPNTDANADSDTLDVRFALSGAAPTADMLFVDVITEDPDDEDELIFTPLGVGTRFYEAGAGVWKLRVTGQKRAVGDTLRLGLYAMQSQNAGGSSYYYYEDEVTILATPTIEFTLTNSSTVDEKDALADGNTLPEPDTNVTLGITITGTIPYVMSVPIVFGSNGSNEATKDADYTSSLQNLLLSSNNSAGESIFTAFVLKDDELVEGNEIVTVTLGDAASTNFLPLGTNKVHTVTIPDDDFAPNITTTPSGGLFYTGSSTTLTVGYTTEGNGKVQWYRNNTPISGATSTSLVLNNLQLSHAGSYFARVSNAKLLPAGGRAFSDTSPEVVAVLKETPGVHGVPSGSNVTLTTTAAGTGLTYLWYNGASPIASATSPSYTFPAASGNYVCRVTLDTTTLLAGEHIVGVINGAPVFPELGVFQPGRVGVAYDQIIPIDTSAGLTPAFTSATGLPPGLTYNPNTLRVTGVPNKPGTYQVTMVARNALGTVTATRSLLINPIPATVLGSYSLRFGFGALANDIGGRADFTLLSNGVVTGSYIIKGKRRSFKGKASGNSGAVYSATIPLLAFEGDAAPSLRLNFDVPGANYVDAVLTHNSGGWTGWGWRQTWAGGTATTRAGRHNFGSTVIAGAVPAGSVAGSFVVTNKGKVTISGKLPDSTSLAGSSVLGPAGEVLFYRELYGSRGALLGGDVPPTIYPVGVPPALDGELLWKKHDTTVLVPPTRDYAPGFDGVLGLTGSSYAPPASGTRVMNLGSASPNLRIDIADGGLPAPVSVDAEVSTGNQVVIVTAPNSSQVSLVLSPGKGTFSGTFMNGTRKVRFNGTFWSTTTSGSGMGWFLDGTGARESGRVTLTPLP